MILISGANGFIGRRLVENEHRLLVRTRSTRANELVGDLLAPESLAAACKNIDTILHCAGFAHAFGRGDAQAHWRINFEGTRNLVDAAGQAGVGRFIFLSSVKAMADPGRVSADEDWPGVPTTPYGQAKRAAEDAVLEAGVRYGMHVVNLRLAMVYGRGGRGNLQRMAQGMRAGWFPPLPETGNRRSLVHVDDVVAALRLVADRPEASGRTYIVADPQAYSGRQIQDAISAVLHRQTRGWAISEGLLRTSGRWGDRLEGWLRRPLPLNSAVISRLLDSECYTPTRIERELGWRARIGLMEGLREMLGDEASV